MLYFDDQDREIIRNRNEEIVLQETEKLLREEKDTCTCRDCRRDVASIVLNSLPSWYQVSDQRRERSPRTPSVELVIGEIKKAIKIVSKHPHHV